MSYEALIGTLRAETLERLSGVGRVLLVQDTTSLDFSGHAAVEGLGTLENKGRRGLFVHSTLAVSETGLPDAKGQAYRLPAGTFFAIRDGRIARITTYYNLTDWIMQVSVGG